MSLIYSLGDRVLVAGVNSRTAGASMTPLYNDNRNPLGFRIHEAIVTGVASHENPQDGDQPCRNGVLFIQYNGTDGAPRSLDYALWMMQEEAFRQRVLRTLDRINGLSPEQRQMLLYYSVPRPIASVAYTHMLRDLAALVTPNADAPRIVINDKDAVFERAAAIGIPTIGFDMYRGVTAQVNEPENMDDPTGAVPSPTEVVYYNPAVVDAVEGTAVSASGIRQVTLGDIESVSPTTRQRNARISTTEINAYPDWTRGVFMDEQQAPVTPPPTGQTFQLDVATPMSEPVPADDSDEDDYDIEDDVYDEPEDNNF